MDSSIRCFVAAESAQFAGFTKPGRGGVRRAQMEPVGLRHGAYPGNLTTLCGQLLPDLVVFHDIEFGNDRRKPACPRCRTLARS